MIARFLPRRGMTPEQLLAHCLAKPGARQDEPWESDAVVSKLPKKDRPAGS